MGTTVTLTRHRLHRGQHGVSFNGTAATDLHVSSATSRTATVPAGATTGNVTVTNPRSAPATGWPSR